MATVRKTLTLDSAAAHAALELGGGNLSAFVNDALLDRVRRDRGERLQALVAHDVAMRGPISDDEISSMLASIDAASV